MNQQLEEKPPYVRFEYRPVEDRAKTIASGHYATKDVAYALITRPGSKDTHEAVVEDWLANLDSRVRQDLCPPSWAEGFRQMFEKWEKGEEIPVEGTPIKGWPVMSPSAQLTIIQAGFRTVEELASAGDTEIGAIGPGAFEFRKKARTWMEQANGPGKATERITALETQLLQLVETNKKLADELTAMKLAAQAKK